MLRWRLILGFVLAGCLTAISWLDHAVQPRGLFLLPVCVVLALLAVQEVLSLLRLAGARPATGAVYAGAILPVVVVAAAPFLNSATLPDNRLDPPPVPAQAISDGLLLGPTLILGVLFCGLAAIRVFDGAKQCATDLAASVFAVIYVGGTLATLALLRLLEAEGPEDLGLRLLLATVAIVKCGDIGAYTVGRLFGRRKLAPRLSPGKTWEGAMGAITFSCVAGAALYLSAGDENASTYQSVLDLGGWLLCSAALAATGMAGDLIESLLKRAAGVKDSSTWLPGFGGVLDILDSLMLSAPVAYGFAVFGLIGW